MNATKLPVAGTMKWYTATFNKHRHEIVNEIGTLMCDDMTMSYRQWAKWLSMGRVQKSAYVVDHQDQEPPWIL